jgi:hypothetical protein
MTGVTSVPACPSCGDRCNDCGDRMCTEYGPAPAARCYEHPTCEACDDTPVYCPECLDVLRYVAEDRLNEAAYDAAREAAR